MKKLLIFLIVLFYMCSCNKNNIIFTTANNESLVNINLNSAINNELIFEEDIIKSVDFIFLETTEKSLVDQIMDVVFSKNRIFILDTYQGGGLIIFDRSGKFVKRLPKGNGPGEINKIHSIAYDKYSDKLLILQNPFVHYYTADGEYIESKKADFAIDKFISILPNGYIFSKLYGHENKTIEGFNTFSTIVTDKDLKIKEVMLPYAFEGGLSNKSTENNDNNYITVPLLDTIYQYNNDSLFAKYVIDFSKNKIDISNIKTIEEYMEIKHSDNPQGMFFEGKFLETSKHQFFQFVLGQIFYEVYVDKENRIIKSGYNYSWQNNELYYCISPYCQINDTLVSIIQPHELKYEITSFDYIKQSDYEKLKYLTEEDNPYFTLITLKDFTND